MKNDPAIDYQQELKIHFDSVTLDGPPFMGTLFKAHPLTFSERSDSFCSKGRAYTEGARSLRIKFVGRKEAYWNRFE